MKHAVAFLLIFVLAASSAAQLAPPVPTTQSTPPDPLKARVMPPEFQSDGCTLFPDGNYRPCCVEHDKDYFFGGTTRERRASDIRLYRCVKGTRGWQNKIAAPLMLIGVRVGGVSFLPAPFRWGFGKKKIKKASKCAQPAEGTKD